MGKKNKQNTCDAVINTGTAESCTSVTVSETTNTLSEKGTSTYLPGVCSSLESQVAK